MTPADFAAALSDRLRRRGVDFRPADVEAFAAGMPPQFDGEPDVEALADRFTEANQFYATHARRKKRAYRNLRDGFVMMGAAAGCIAISATAIEILNIAPPKNPLMLGALYVLLPVWIAGVIVAVVGFPFVLAGSLSLAWIHLRSWMRSKGERPDEDRLDDQ